MSFINCPKCNKTISNTINQCTNCGYILNKNIDIISEIPDSVNPRKQINRKIILGILVIAAFFLLLYILLPNDKAFRKYTKYIGKQYTDLSDEYIKKKAFKTTFYMQSSYLPEQIDFDKLGGTLEYTCADEGYPSVTVEYGEIISMCWAPDSEYVYKSDVEQVIKSLEKAYDKCKNIDYETSPWDTVYSWENINEMDINLFIKVYSNDNVSYLITWEQTTK